MHTLDLLKEVTILVVDDDDAFLVSTCKTLEMLGARVLSASNGHDALKLFQTHTIMIVIADVRMGDMSGLTLAHEIRMQDRTIPIVIVSSYTQTEDLLRACRLNLVEYLVKPFSFQTLAQTLKMCLEKLAYNRTLYHTLTPAVRYNPYTKTLFKEDVEIALSKNEIIVLELFIEHRGQVLSYDVLAHALGETVSIAAIKNSMLRLRKKIGEEVIVNVQKIGYLLR